MGLKSYFVLDECDADERAKETILDSLWAFNTDFIINHSRIDMTAYNEDKIEKAISKMQEKLAEDANPIIMALLIDKDDFVENALEADGRGHFLNPYDGSEEEVEHEGRTYYIYRQN